MNTWDVCSALDLNSVPIALPGTELDPSHKQRLLWSFHLMKMSLKVTEEEEVQTAAEKRGLCRSKMFHITSKIKK